MLHYLFTNDLRRNMWPDILVESAKLIRDDKVPDQNEDKSKNNYINTQQSYLCIHKGTKANAVCCNGDVKAIILNFVNRFQYPNARTFDSYQAACEDGMSVAPLRLAVQLLFVLNQIAEKEAHISYAELAKYVICDPIVASGTKDVVSLAQQIIADRKNGVQVTDVPDSETLDDFGVEWKHCPRQIKELFGLLEYVPFIKTDGVDFKLQMSSAIDPLDARFFFHIVNNKKMWRPVTGTWQEIRDSYRKYMDEGIEQCLSITGCGKKDELPPNVDRLSIALKLFAEKRKETGDGGWLDVGRSVNARIREYFDPLTESAIKSFDASKIAELFCGFKDADGKTFETMWSGKNGQGWGHIKPADEQAVKDIVDFLVELKTDAGISSRFLQKGFKHPKGFGSSVITELLMKFHPGSCVKHGERSHDALAWLGFVDFPWSSDYSETDYKVVCGAAAKILQKMQSMKIPRLVNADGSVDNSPPDYLTVNEFIYFVNTNQDLIKEKIMGAQWKPVDSKAKMKNGTKKLKDAMSDDMLKRLAAALRTKPFAILAGHSGTGKSRLVRRLAYMTCNNEMLIEEGKGKSAPGNYCMVQVKPNWHDSTDLLGYYSEMGERHFVNTPFVEFICKAYAYPDTPFFVCLDEMNLAPVEQYFAEYLSAVESMEKKDGVWVTDALVDVDKTEESGADGKQKASSEIVGQIMKGAASTEAAEWIQAHGLTIPKNLFVVGTVNMDETTCQFSRKVLDRAMTLLMNEVKFSEMANSKKPSEEELLDADGIKFFLEGEGTGAVGGIESGLLDGVNEQLGNTPFVIAYRFANEYALYEAAWAKLSDMDMEAATDDEKKNLAAKALDHVVMMKLLPRIHGERRVVEGIFNGRKDKRADGDKDLPGLKVKLPDGLSAKMMDEILARRDEYLTFWP